MNLCFKCFEIIVIMFQKVEDLQVLTFFQNYKEIFVPWDEAKQGLFYPLKS